MKAINKNSLISLVFVFFTSICSAVEFLDAQGHIKLQQQYFSTDQDSLDSFIAQSQSAPTLFDFRFINEFQHKQWSLVTHYQLNSINGSAVEINNNKNSFFPLLI